MKLFKRTVTARDNIHLHVVLVVMLSNYRGIGCGDWNLVSVDGSLVSVSGGLRTVSPRLISLNRGRLHSVSLLRIRRCNEDLGSDCSEHAVTCNSGSSSPDIYDDNDEGDEDEDGRDDVCIGWDRGSLIIGIHLAQVRTGTRGITQ